MKNNLKKLYKFYVKQLYPNISDLRGSDWIQRKLKPFTFDGNYVLDNYEGFDVKINPIEYVGGEVYKEKKYEEELTNYLKDNLQVGDVVVEIGGHIGLHSLVIREKIGEEGKLSVFEPEPENREILEKNLELNGFTGVEVNEHAISNQKGEADFHLDDKNTGAASLKSGHGKEKITVPLITLEEYLNNSSIEKIDLVKIDVEGAELDVLEGMDLENKRYSKILIEIHWERIEEHKWEQKMQNSNFQASDIFGNNLENPQNLDWLKENLDPNFIILENVE